MEVYSEEEEALLQRVRQKFEGSLEESKWTQLKVRSCRNEATSKECIDGVQGANNQLGICFRCCCCCHERRVALSCYHCVLLIVASPVAPV